MRNARIKHFQQYRLFASAKAVQLGLDRCHASLDAGERVVQCKDDPALLGDRR